MSHECSGCGLRSCDGRCFDECEADFEPIEEVAAPRVKHVRSPEYVRWCAEVDAARTTVVHSDPLLKRGVA
jgi:hypothetical protein